MNKVCKMCGNIIANPDNKTGICPRCSEKGKKIIKIIGFSGVALSGISKIVYYVKKSKN